MAADTILGRAAASVGATEPALRLLISILVGKWLFFIIFAKQICINVLKLMMNN